MSSMKKSRNVLCELSPDYRKSFSLISFSNGWIKSANRDALKFNVYNHREINGQSMIPNIMCVESDRLHYSGLDINNLSLKSGLPKYQVAVVNKKTQKMRIYDANVFRCKPVLDVTCEISAEGRKDERSYAEKMDYLTNSFGSKQGKRAVASKLRSSIKASEASLANAVAKSVTSETSIVSSSDVKADVIPPRNSKALTPAEIYNIYDIISRDEYKMLDENAKKLEEATLCEIENWECNELYCSYVLRHLKCNAGKLSNHKAKLLLYFNYLVMLLKLGYKELQKKDPLPEIPELFKNNILSKFIATYTSENGKQNRSFPSRMKDKVMAYGMVLSLFIDDFCLSTTELQKNFKVSAPKLTKLANSLGCYVNNKQSNGMQVKVIVLKLPLFTERTFLKRKRKGF